MSQALFESLQRSSFLSLETTPTHSASFEPTLQKLEQCNLPARVDAFSTTDNPLAKLKFSAIIAAYQLQQRFNKPVLATMSMRDRNKIALQSDLLGANALDVTNILALTGDPASISDQPKSSGVFEGNSTLLLEIINCFNSGIDYAGKPFTSQPKPIHGFAVSNAYAKTPSTLYKKLHKKVEAGAVGIITQPLYHEAQATALLEMLEKINQEQLNANSSQLILGFFPITKLRTAQFLSSHVPGIHVPKQWLDALRAAKSSDDEYKIGFEMSYHLFNELKSLHPYIHMMTANQFDLADALLQ